MPPHIPPGSPLIYMAYQEIAMYISGVLGIGEPDTLEISDEDMRDEKGFFDMSFKKDAGVTKPRRRGKKCPTTT